MLITNKGVAQNTVPFYLFPDSINTDWFEEPQDQYHAFIGNYKSAMKHTSAWFYTKQATIDSFANAKQLQLQDINTFIANIPDSVKVLLFNEGHMYGVNRVVLKNLLPQLKAKGFDCLCMEDYAHADKAISKYGFPTSSSGFYINETSYAQMVRQAIQLGYKLYPIETNRTIVAHTDSNGSLIKLDSITGDTISVLYARNFVPYYGRVYINYREEDQALNIKNALSHCKRVVTLSGHGHIYKSGDFMGRILVDSFHIQPYSIDQYELTEAINNTNADSIEQEIQTNSVAVPIAAGKPVTLIKGVDAHIATPGTSFIKGRPSWLINIDNRVLLPLKLPNKTTYPLLVKAYYTKEYNITHQAIPVDVFIVPDNKTIPDAALYKANKYTIVITDTKGKQYAYKQTVL